MTCSFSSAKALLFGPALFERILARSSTPIVFDFDDAIWVPYVSPANGYLSYYLKCFGKTFDALPPRQHGDGG